MTNKKSIFPLQPTGVGSKSGGVPMSHVPADAAAVLAASSLAESSPVLVLPELLVLVLPELLVLVLGRRCSCCPRRSSPAATRRR
jgi:hypothetical protein